jgi:hypothetical protein
MNFMIQFSEGHRAIMNYKNISFQHEVILISLTFQGVLFEALTSLETSFSFS